MSAQTSEVNVGEKRKAAAALAPKSFKLIDGLSYKFTEDDKGVVTIEFSFVKSEAGPEINNVLAQDKDARCPWRRPQVGRDWFDWRKTPGYLTFGPPGGSPILIRKLQSVTGPIGYHSSRGGPDGCTYETQLAKTEPEATIESPLGDALDEQGAAEADAVAKKLLQVPKAFVGFLDACGGALDVDLQDVEISNKATYTHFVVTTPGGSVFRVESREGGVYDSKVKAKARKDPAAFLRALMELGDESSGTYCRATLPTRGADLTIGPDGFEILEPSKGSTKEGSFTCPA